MARDQVSAVDSSARRRSWLHSDMLMKSSIVAAMLFLKAGMGGVVVEKSRRCSVALGAGPRRRSDGMVGAIVMVWLLFGLSRDNGCLYKGIGEFTMG